MHESGYIEDGYNRPGYIEGRRNMFDDLRFEYRPMLYVDRRKILDKSREPGQAAVAIKTIVRHLGEWDLKKPVRVDGKITGKEVVKISEEEVWRVHPDLMEAIFLIVCGQIPSDTDPNWSDQDKQQSEEEDLNAALSGTTAGSERENADSKN